MKKNPTARPTGLQKNPGKRSDASAGFMGRPMGRVGGPSPSVPDFAGRPMGTPTGHGLPATGTGRGGSSSGRRGNYLGRKSGR